MTSLTNTLDHTLGKTGAMLVEYGTAALRKTPLEDCAALEAFQPQPGSVCWLDIYGLQNREMLQAMARRFQLHDSAVDDIYHCRMPHRTADHGSYLFFSMQVCHVDDEQKLLSTPMYLVFGQGFIITVQAHHQGLFQPLRQQLEIDGCSLRQQGSDFLAYSLVEVIVGHYFNAINELNKHVEAAGAQLLARMDDKVPNRVYRLDKDALGLRRALPILQDTLAQLTSDNDRYFTPATLGCMRDMASRVELLNNMLGSVRDMLSNLYGLYQSVQSNQLNLQMRVLTVITIIFMPLTLISGIYGMNFENMPELHWRYGYFVALGGMVSIASSLIFLFWKKRWL
jgi:magnesium transporter